ncbi:MAG TPA: LLM class flavin-dependent oxidoreductase [Brevundimonas sp.]
MNRWRQSRSRQDDRILRSRPLARGSGGDVARALDETTRYARSADRLGYRRFWLAEHHNMPGIASAATSVVIGHVAGATKTIRVGSGGIMLPNHAPMVIAEQFGTLEALYPGRIDLGLGRAPGTDGETARALRRYFDAADQFPRDVLELQAFLAPAVEGQRVRAVPGAGSNVPVWLLGSSLFSAELAAQLGLPFAFASHFAPELLMQALHTYRAGYRPSAANPQPYAMAVMNVFAADSEVEAQHLSTSMQQAFAAVVTGKTIQLPPPVDDIASVLDARARAAVESRLQYAAIGDAGVVRDRLNAFAAGTGVDEVMVTGMIFDVKARIRSLEITAEAVGLG